MPDGDPIQVITPARSVPLPVLDFSHLPPAERERMGQAGRAYVLAHHEWSVLAARFMAALEDARGGHA